VNGFVEELQRRAHQPPDATLRWLASQRLPHVDGRSVTFVFYGEADAVLLRHWIFGLPSSQPFTRVPHSPLWHLTLDLPERSRVEYKLEVARGPAQQLVQDPLNPSRAHDPFGSNSVVHGAGYEVPAWVEHDPEARAGHLEQHELHSDAFGGRRAFQLYFPARYRTLRRYPLLIVHDGQDYLRFSRLQLVLDNLIHRLEVPSMLVALIQPDDRMREYADDPRHAQFLVHELTPHLESRYPLLPGPGGRALMGASFGAVAALAAAWRHPGCFGRLLLQSGSFVFTDVGGHDRGPAFDPVVAFVNAFRKNPGLPAERVYLSCGQYESLIYYNRSLYPLLQQTGMQVRFTEARDGHNWENWRDRLREGLSYLLPGPLWYVYE
jgi:enterochelin esterase family protein